MADIRATYKEKITPPYPLPYVSRRALKRVRDAVPPPVFCPYCGEGPELVSNKDVYGREYGSWPYLYLCRPCDAYVGLHPGTDLPLGLMADRATREARKKGKAVFHQMIDLTGLSRKEAYHLLADELGIDHQHCHWGCFDKRQAEEAEQACRNIIGAGSGKIVEGDQS